MELYRAFTSSARGTVDSRSRRRGGPQRRLGQALANTEGAGRCARGTICQRRAVAGRYSGQFLRLALPTVTLDHADSAPLAVLSGVLRNAYLHTAIRERAVRTGAGASQDSALGCFKFYSIAIRAWKALLPTSRLPSIGYSIRAMERI